MENDNFGPFSKNCPTIWTAKIRPKVAKSGLTAVKPAAPFATDHLPSLLHLSILIWPQITSVQMSSIKWKTLGRGSPINWSNY